MNMWPLIKTGLMFDGICSKIDEFVNRVQRPFIYLATYRDIPPHKEFQSIIKEQLALEEISTSNLFRHIIH